MSKYQPTVRHAFVAMVTRGGCHGNTNTDAMETTMVVGTLLLLDTKTVVTVHEFLRVLKISHLLNGRYFLFESRQQQPCKPYYAVLVDRLDSC